MYSPISGSVADVYNATYIAAELATRLIRPGNTNQQVTEALTNIGQNYEHITLFSDSIGRCPRVGHCKVAVGITYLIFDQS